MRTLNFESNRPLIYLVATPIGNLKEVSQRTLETLQEVDIIACEDTRNTLKLLNCFGIKKQLVSLREHNEVSISLNLIKQVKQGGKLAYVSDAGYPCISDPGCRLVQLAIENEINVTTISGPNAALNALVSSGLDTSHFYFHGFLSPKTNDQAKELELLKNRPETLIFYESPHRIDATLKTLYEILGDRKACIARELTKKHEEYIRDSLSNLVKIEKETLKGEMVIVVEGFPEIKKAVSEEEILLKINEFKENGLSTKDAVKETALHFGINKNWVYDLQNKK